MLFERSAIRTDFRLHETPNLPSNRQQLSDCKSSGFVPSVKLGATYNLGQLGGGSVTGTFYDGGGTATVSLGYGGYGNATGTATIGTGINPTISGDWSGSVGAGSAAFGGVGGTYTSPSAQCGC